MATNDQLLALRVPGRIKRQLELLYPDTATRNNVIRAMLKKIADKQLVLATYEIELQNPSQ
jgi:hypothetical protein